MYFTENHICTVINFLQLPEPTKICCTMYLSPYHPPVPNSAKFCKYAENLPKRANATAQLKILQKTVVSAGSTFMLVNKTESRLISN